MHDRFMTVSEIFAQVKKIVFSRSSPEGIKLVKQPLKTGADDKVNVIEFCHVARFTLCPSSPCADWSDCQNPQVLCRVACAGINPVDAKGLVGDKVPSWLAGFRCPTTPT